MQEPLGCVGHVQRWQIYSSRTGADPVPRERHQVMDVEKNRALLQIEMQGKEVWAACG